MKDNSELLTKMLGLLYPFIILFGFYIILNGHITPGGGFQGGAVLSAVFITRYLVHPVQDIQLNKLQFIEKGMFVFILAVPTLFLLMHLNQRYSSLNIPYLIFMNILIGIKVWCGLSILFFRFVFYEGR